MTSVRAVASPNIAFIKYWGARDVDLGLPLHPSLSMTLSRCTSRCTLEPIAGERDEVRLVADGSAGAAPERFAAPVRRHLETMRRAAGRGDRFRVTAENDFPAASGLASSASGFAALTLAAAHALGLEEDPARLSDLARRSGSGSAARSLFGGYVEWPVAPGATRTGATSVGPASAGPVAPAEHWDLRDVIGIVDPSPKAVSSREGHRRSATSPYMEERLRRLPERFRVARDAVLARDLDRLGPILEEEAVDLHLIAMSSRPPIFYWRPGTVEVLEAVHALRAEGVPAWSTLDAGPNVHVICPPGSEAPVVERLASLPLVRDVIRDRVGPGPTVEAEPERSERTRGSRGGGS